MRPLPSIGTVLSVLATLALVASAAPVASPADSNEAADLPRLPWRQAGLTERQAAAHLLDRFAYGPRPGEVEAVVALGLDTWLARQLTADLPEADLERRLAPFRTLDLSLSEMVETYPNPGLVLREAMAAGRMAGEKGSGERELENMEESEREELRRRVLRYGMEQGYRSQRELLGEMMAARLYRAVYGENQLAQVLTDFWYNHFYVSLADPESRSYAPAYERDAIRPHVLGDFRTLLGATAHHPAMLLYLDNARSTAAEGAPTTLERELDRRGFGQGALGRGRFEDRTRFGSRDRPEPPSRDRPRGLNENYARELLELHTLGVDGGYSQEDVVAVARAFTGWTVLPPGPMRERAQERLARVQRAGRRVGLPALGFVQQGELLFRADAHDAGEKRILGVTFPAGRGMEDGEEVLDLLARHPATARHVATQLAVRFVSDSPPPALVDRLAATFQATGGDLRAVVLSLAESPELWASEARGAKIKSPFELAASALRGLAAQVDRPRATVEWIARMGEPLYLYPAPTGYPDRAETWVNTGALLARMSFGLQLAAGRVEGVELELAALTGGREPASRKEALATCLSLLLPGREHAATVEQLLAVVQDPELARRVAEAAPGDGDDPFGPYLGPPAGEEPGGGEALLDGPFSRRRSPPARSYPEPTPLQQVVGVILGSPEFQRR